MLDLNFSTAEELVFHDRNVQNALPPHYFSLFEQWRIAKRLPMLKSVGTQAVLDFLNSLNSEDIERLEEHFGEKIMVEKLSYSIARNFKIPLSETEICQQLCEVTDLNYFSTWRDDEFLYISFWR